MNEISLTGKSPQVIFEESWVMARTYAANAARRYILENPEATPADLLAHFEVKQSEAEKAFGRYVNANGVVVPLEQRSAGPSV